MIAAAANPPVRLLVTGSREWTDEAAIRRVLAALPPRSAVIHGGARGADSIADRVAKELGLNTEVYPAEWKVHAKGWCRCPAWRVQFGEYCPAAGARRNARMLDLAEPERAAAFLLPAPKSKGTRDMVVRLKAAGVDVLEVEGQPVAVRARKAPHAEIGRPRVVSTWATVDDPAAREKAIEIIRLLLERAKQRSVGGR